MLGNDGSSFGATSQMTEWLLVLYFFMKVSLFPSRGKCSLITRLSLCYHRWNTAADSVPFHLWYLCKSSWQAPQARDCHCAAAPATAPLPLPLPLRCWRPNTYIWSYGKERILCRHSECVCKLNKVRLSNQCGAALITSVSFTSNLAFHIHNIGEKNFAKNFKSLKIKKKVIGFPWLKAFCWFVFIKK